jgi:pyridoxine 5'-phosphate synthase PdxJ
MESDPINNEKEPEVPTQDVPEESKEMKTEGGLSKKEIKRKLKQERWL